MRKNLFFLPLILMLSYNIYGQTAKGFVVKGTIADRNWGELYLLYYANNKQVIDSAQIRNGNFVFRGSINEPTAAELTDNLKMRKKEYGNYLSDFYLEQSVMQLKVVNNHFADAKLSGSKADEDFQHLMRYVNPAFERIFKLENELKTATGGTNLVSDSLWYCKNKVKKFLLDFIMNNQNSYISILAIQRLIWLKQMSNDSLLSTFNLLTQRINKTIAARKLKEYLIYAINSSIGHFSPDFKRKDVNGQTITLSSFKGNYVLLDFWASWCAPCRAKTPFVKSIYEKYNFKGLKVIAVSCDLKYNAWEKAIVEDSVQRFINILSFTDTDMDFLKDHDKAGEASFKGELRKQYNLMPIPAYILIDPKGMVIGRYGPYEKEPFEALNQDLAQIFAQR